MNVKAPCLLTLLCAATTAHAQFWPAYPYRPAYPNYPPTGPAYYYSPPPVYYPPHYYAEPRPAVPPIQALNPKLRAETIADEAPPTVSEGRENGTVTLAWNHLVEWLRWPDEDSRPRSETFFVSGHYVAASFRPMRLAGPLVTTGSVLDPVPGALGSRGTIGLFADRQVDHGLASGASVTAGWFLDPSRRFSLEGNMFFALPERTTAAFASNGNGDPLIARPIFATDFRREAVFFTALPGATDGAVNVHFRSALFGAEANARYHADCGRRFHADCGRRFHADALAGIRYARFTERMEINENIAGINGTTFPFAGQAFPALASSDSFAAINDFIGGQIGGRVAYDHPWFNLGVFAKLGLGATMQEVAIAGSTSFISPAGSLTVPGGVLALSSNSGNHQRTVFGILPEMGVNLGVNVTHNVRLEMGYSALLWNQVVRPGLNYDRAINTSLAPGSPTFGAAAGPIAPRFRFNDETFWAHILRIGIEVRY